jgi:hypothetical protein
LVPLGGSPSTPPAPSPLPSGLAVIPSRTQIPAPSLAVYRSWNLSPPSFVSPSYAINTDLAQERTDLLILSSVSFDCRALVNSLNFRSKFFFVLLSAAFLYHSALSALLCGSLCASRIFLASARASAYSPDIRSPSSLALTWMIASSRDW